MLIGVAAATLLAAFFAEAKNQELRRNIQINIYGIELTKDQLDECWEVFNDAGIVQYFYEHIVGIAWEDGEPVAVLCGYDELSIAVHPDHQGQGLGTVLMAAFLEAGGDGYMVAGTEAGSCFLRELPMKLGGFPEELEVPSWEGLQEEWAEHLLEVED